jgi:hypothetical protein
MNLRPQHLHPAPLIDFHAPLRYATPIIAGVPVQSG